MSTELSGDSATTMKVCRVCLVTGLKMYHMPEHKLSIVYELVTGIEINTEDELPKTLCWECVARLSSAHKFIKKALKTNLILVDKLKSSRFISMGDIESIDKTQLKSTLGVKVYRENFSNLHIIKESDNINENKEQIFVEKDPIKLEYLVETEEQKFEYEDNIKEDIYNNGNEIKFLNINLKIEPDEVSDEMPIDNEGDDSVDDRKYDIKNPLSNKWSEELPCKELKVVVEDIMLNPIEHNTQDTFKYVTEAQSTKDDKKNIFHQPINKKILFEDEDNSFKTLNHSTNIVKVSKYIEILCDNSSVDYPASTSQMWTGSVDNNTHNAPSFKVLLASDKLPQTKISRTIRSKKQPNSTTNTNNIDYKCKYCTYETNFKSRLKYHVNTKHRPHSYHCDHCDFVTTVKATLTGHINAKHTKNIIFNCPHCIYKTHIKTNLRAHVNNRHTKNRTFNCSYCDYETTIKPNLIKHINNKHTKIDIFKCSFCNYKVYNKLSLDRHVNAKHTNANVFNCSYCTFKSYRRCHLNTHLNAKHPELMLSESNHS